MMTNLNSAIYFLTSDVGELGKIFLYIFMFIIVIAGAYMFTRFIGLKSNFNGLNNRHIKVIERLGISKDSTLLLISIGTKIYLIGSTSHDTSILAELNKEDVLNKDDSILERPGLFDGVLNKVYRSKGASNKVNNEQKSFFDIMSAVLKKDKQKDVDLQCEIDEQEEIDYLLTKVAKNSNKFERRIKPEGK